MALDDRFGPERFRVDSPSVRDRFRRLHVLLYGADPFEEAEGAEEEEAGEVSTKSARRAGRRERDAAGRVLEKPFAVDEPVPEPAGPRRDARGRRVAKPYDPRRARRSA